MNTDCIDRNVFSILYNSADSIYHLFDRHGNKIKTIAYSRNQAIASTYRVFEYNLDVAVQNGEFSEKQLDLDMTRYVRVEFTECPDCGFTVDVCGECGRCAQCCREQGCGQHPHPVKVYRQPTAERHPLARFIR